MEPKRDAKLEPSASASIMSILNDLPVNSQARVLLAVCGWCGFDGAIYGLVRHATGTDGEPPVAVPPPLFSGSFPSGMD